MALTFYHVPNSTSNATAAVFAELNYRLAKPINERVELSLKNGDTHTPSFLSTINPNGRVPAIVHDGVPIWESSAITMYLGETFGVEKGLYPTLGPQRGEAMKWIVWTNIVIVEPGRRLFSTMMPGDRPPHDLEGTKQTAMEDLRKALAILDGRLKGREYLLDQGYTLADTHVWSFVRWLTFMQVDLSQHGDVTAWFQRVGARPAIVEEVSGK